MARWSDQGWDVASNPPFPFEMAGQPGNKREAQFMNDLKYPEWQSPFQEALLEVDREKLQSKMMKAEEAIFQRMCNGSTSKPL